MAFYGYQPQAKQYGGIGQAIGYAGQAIGAGIDQAVQASKDWNQMENAIKGIRKTYQSYGQSLVEKDVLSQEAFQLGLDRLRLPTEADKNNPQGYIEEMQQRASEAFKVFAGKEDMLIKKERTQTVQRIGEEAAKGRMATVGTQRMGAPAAQEGAQPGQYTTEGAAPGFQTYQPAFGRIGGAKTQEEAVARTESGLAAEGQMPLEEEELKRVQRIGAGEGLLTEEQRLAREKEKRLEQPKATKLQEERIALDKEKFAHQKAMDTIKKAKATPQQYDKVLQTTISNKFKAKGLSKQYSALVKTMEQAIDKAEGGIIGQMLQQKLVDRGYEGEMTVPAIQALLPEMEKARIDADRDTKFYEEQIRIIEKTPKPTQIGTQREARLSMAERELPERLDELARIRGFAYYRAQDPMISKTGEINISHPKIQDAIRQKLIEGYTLEQIAEGLQEETAYMGKQ